MQEKLSENKVVNVLWTGGYDSSYRMVELSRKNVSIQPFYIDDGRKSRDKELNAIKEITRDIEKHPDTKCTILPLIIKKHSNIKPDESITNSIKALREIVLVGTQYDSLARFAKENNLMDLELGIEKSDTSMVITLFNKLNITLELIEDGDISYYKVNDKNTDPDVLNVFGRFHYPSSLYNLTKLELIDKYRELGFEETMKKTWFCHFPIRNKPCGRCNPCRSVLAEGMGFRLPKISKIRNKHKVIGAIDRHIYYSLIGIKKYVGSFSK